MQVMVRPEDAGRSQQSEDDDKGAQPAPQRDLTETLKAVYGADVDRRITIIEKGNAPIFSGGLEALERGSHMSNKEINSVKYTDRVKACGEMVFHGLSLLRRDAPEAYGRLLREGDDLIIGFSGRWLNENLPLDGSVDPGTSVDEFTTAFLERVRAVNLVPNLHGVLHRVTLLTLLHAHPEKEELFEDGTHNLHHSFRTSIPTQKEKLHQLAENICDVLDSETLTPVLEGIERYVKRQSASKTTQIGPYAFKKDSNFSFSSEWFEKGKTARLLTELKELFGGPELKQELLIAAHEITTLLHYTGIGMPQRHSGHKFLMNTPFWYHTGHHLDCIQTAIRQYGVNQIHFAWKKAGAHPNPLPNFASFIGIKITQADTELRLRYRGANYGPFTQESNINPIRNLPFVAAFLQHNRKAALKLLQESREID